MNKVASYIGNLGKSVAYATADAFKEINPNATDLGKQGYDTVKTGYNYFKDIKRNNIINAKTIQNNQVYKLADSTIKNIFSDLKTGNFYNKERIDKTSDEMTNAFMDGFDFDMGFDDLGFDPDSIDDIGNSSSGVASANAVSKKVMESAGLMSDTVARTGQYVAEVNKASTNLIYSEISKVNADLNTGLNAINAGIQNVLNFSTTVLKTHVDNSKTYYETTTKELQTQTAMMKELLEMQRNLYKKEQDRERKQNKIGDIVNYGGTLNLDAYAKLIKSNAKNILDSSGIGMITSFGSMFGGGTKMMESMLANPIGMALTTIIKSAMSKDTKKKLETFDKSLSGVFSTLIGKFNEMGKYSSDGGTISNLIGRLLGVDNSLKTKVDTSKFEKGPIPFDGITKKAIVEVIPGYLRKIESLLTGQTERVFDYREGRFTNAAELRAKYEKMKSREVADAASGFREHSSKYIKDEMVKGNAEEMKALTKTLNTFFTKVWENGGYFNPNKTPTTEYGKYGFNSEKEFQSLLNYYKAAPKSEQLAMTGRMMKSRASYSDAIREVEKGALPADLFNNSNLRVTSQGPGVGGGLLNTKDNKGHNIFYYMQNILNELTNMRVNGSAVGSKNKPRGKAKNNTLKDYIPLNTETNTIDFVNLNNNTEDEGLTEKEKNDKRNKEARENWLTELESVTNMDSTTLDYILTDKIDEKKKGKLAEKIENSKGGRKAKQLFDKLKDYATKPSRIIGDAVTAADNALYRLVFGQPSETKEGKPINGFMNAMIEKMKETFDNFNTWLHTFMEDKFGVKTFGELFNKILEDTGIKDKLNKGKEKLVGENGVLRPYIDSTKSKFKSAGRYIKNSLYDVYSPIADAILGEERLHGKDKRKTNIELADMDIISRIGKVTGLNRRATSEEERQIRGKELASVFRGTGGSLGTRKKAKNLDYTLDKADLESVGEFAKGSRYVTKSGIASISKGELIIPSELNPFNPSRKSTNKGNEIAIEKANKRKFMNDLNNEIFGAADGNIEDTTAYEKNKAGTRSVNVDGDVPLGHAMVNEVKSGLGYLLDRLFGKKNKDKTGKTDPSDILGDLRRNIKEYAPDMAGSGLLGGAIGAAVTLSTGLVGGPLVGAALGASVSLAKKSSVFQNFLFGEENADGEREDNGLFSKKFQENFKKYAPDMGTLGVAGAVTGLITPLGAIGGLMLGSTIGFIKNNDTAMKFFYGEDYSLFGVDGKDKLKKALPRMGAGALIGAVAGPFGIVGNAAIGSALGLVTTTDKFQDLMFGEINEETGEREGGIVGTIRETIIDPIAESFGAMKDKMIDFVNRDMLDPLRASIAPIAVGIRDFFSTLLKGARFSLYNKIGVPLQQTIKDYVIDPIKNTAGRLIKLMLAPAKLLVSAPFKTVGAIGNKLKERQIKAGTATYMTAEERLGFMQNRRRGRGISYKNAGIDSMLSDMSADDLAEMRDVLGSFKENGADNYYQKKENAAIRSAAKTLLSDFTGKNAALKDFFDPRVRNAILKAGNKGDFETVEKLISRRGRNGQYLNADEREALSSKLAAANREIIESKQRRENATGTREELYSYLQSKGLNVNDKNIKQYMAMVNSEFKAKAGARGFEGHNDPIANANKENADRIVDVIEKTNAILKRMSGLPLNERETSLISGIDIDDKGLTTEQRMQNNAAEYRRGIAEKRYVELAQKKFDKFRNVFKKRYSEETINAVQPFMQKNPQRAGWVASIANTKRYIREDGLELVFTISDKNYKKVKKIGSYIGLNAAMIETIVSGSDRGYNQVLEMCKLHYPLTDKPNDFKKLYNMDKATFIKVKSLFSAGYTMGLDRLISMDGAEYSRRMQNKNLFKNETKKSKSRLDSIPGGSLLGFGRGRRKMPKEDLANAKQDVEYTDNNAIIGTESANNTKPTGIIGKAKRKIHTLLTEHGPMNFEENTKGDKVLADDKQTRDTKDAIEQDKEERKGIFGKLQNFGDSVTGFMKKMFGGANEDEEDDRSLFSKIVGRTGKTLLKIFGVSTAIGMLPILYEFWNTKVEPGMKSLWFTKMAPFLETHMTTLYNGLNSAAASVGQFIRDIPNNAEYLWDYKILPWLGGTGDYEGRGLPALMMKAGNFYANGFEFLLGTIAPAFVEALVVALPGIVKGAVKGFGRLMYNLFYGKEGTLDESFDIQTGRKSVDGSKYADSFAKTMKANTNGQYQSVFINPSVITSKDTDPLITLPPMVKPDTTETNEYGLQNLNTYSGNGEASGLSTSQFGNTLDPSMGGMESIPYYDEYGNPVETTGSNPKDIFTFNFEDSYSSTNADLSSYGFSGSTALSPDTLGDGNKFLIKNPDGTIIDYLNSGIVYDEARSAKEGVPVYRDVKTGIFYTYDKGSESYKTLEKSYKKKEDTWSKGLGTVGGIGGRVFAQAALTGRKPGFVTALDNLKINPTGGAYDALGSLVKAPGKAIGGLGSIGADVNTAINSSKRIKDMNAAVSLKAEDKLGKALKSASTTSTGAFAGIKNKLKGAFNKLFSNKKIVSLVAKYMPGMEKQLPRLGQEIAEEIAKNAAKKGAEAAARAGSKLIPVINVVSTVGFAVADFISGWNNANSILGVTNAYDVGPSGKLLAALLKTINGSFGFGIIPEDKIVDIFIIALEKIGVDMSSLKADRAASEQEVGMYNNMHGTDYDMYDYNNKDKWYNKIKEGASNWWLGEKNAETGKREGGAWNTIKGGAAKVGGGIKQFGSDIGSYLKDQGKQISSGWNNFWYGADGTDELEKQEKMVNGIKDGTASAEKDIQKVKSGKMTIFNKDYWSDDANSDDENPINRMGKMYAFNARMNSAIPAMISYMGVRNDARQKRWAQASRDGSAAAERDIDNVRAGKYTIFSPSFWKNDGSTANDGNPITGMGRWYGFTSRLNSAPSAMLSYINVKNDERHRRWTSSIKNGYAAAEQDVNAARAGKISIFSKAYWKNDNVNEENPINGIGKVAAFIYRLISAPSAAVNAALNDSTSFLSRAVSIVKSGREHATNMINQVRNGKLKLASRTYWSLSGVDTGNPLNILSMIESWMIRLFNAPVLIFQDIWNGLKHFFNDEGNTVQTEHGEVGTAYNNALMNARGIGIGNGRSGGARRASGGYDKGTNYMDPAVSQNDSGISGINYTAPGDTKYQTIGDVGCAPVTAANIINRAKGPGSISVRKAAEYAIKGGYKVEDSGTEISYFPDILAKNGINSRMAANSSDVLRGLASGNSAVLLGQDETNRSSDPYGSNPHIVLASGISEDGKVIVKDPYFKGERAYNPNQLFSSTNSGIVVYDSLYTAGLGRKYGGARNTVNNLMNGGFGIINGVSNNKNVNAPNYYNNLLNGYIKKSNNKANGGPYKTNVPKKQNTSSGSSSGSSGGSSWSDDYSYMDTGIYTDMGSTGSPLSAGNGGSEEMNAKIVYKFMKEQYGMSPVNIAGMLGNWAVESGIDPTGVEGIYDEKYTTGPKKNKAMANPSAHAQWLFNQYRKQGLKINQKAYSGGNGVYYPGLGLGQFTGPAGKKLIDMGKELGLHWYDMNTQLKYITTPGSKGYREAWLSSWRQSPSPNPAEAARKFLHKWEGVTADSQVNLAKRQRIAQDYYNRFSTWGDLSNLQFNSNGLVSGSSGESSGGNTLLDALAKLGTSVARAIYGDDVYNAFFGAETSNMVANAVADNATGTGSATATALKGVGSNYSSMKAAGNYNGAADRWFMQTFSSQGAKPYVSSPYRQWRSTSNRYHYGIDYAGSGTVNNKNILSPVSGTVVANGYDKSAGNFVNVRDGNGFVHKFFHQISRSPLSKGAVVQRGQPIGRVGSTGHSSGPHLHYQVNVPGGAWDDVVNPNTYLSAVGLGRGNETANISPLIDSGFYNKKYTYSDMAKLTSAPTAGNRREVGEGPNGPNYSDMIKTIIDTLLIIARNSDNLSKILSLLNKKFGLEINESDIKPENEATTRAKLQKVMDTNAKANSSNGFGSMLTNKDTKYILDAMTALAKE